MKKILIPTDFSKNAFYAINYGAGLASALHARITLLHAYHIPVLTDAAVMQQATLDEWEHDNKEELKKIAVHLQAAHPGLEISIDSHMGFAEDEILSMAASGQYDMVIMGSKGMDDLEENIFGAITPDIVRQCRIPVLVVPPHAVYKPESRIVLACNNPELITHKVNQAITTLVQDTHARLYILDIVRPVDAPQGDPHQAGLAIKNLFAGLVPSVHIVENEKVIHGINAFCEEHNADMVIMLPEKHSLFERLFTEIHTRHMVKDLHRPMLVIPVNE